MSTTQFDAALELSLDIMRVDASVRREVLALLKKMEKELVGQIASDVSEWSKTRTAKQLAEVRAVIKSYYDQVSGLAIDSTAAIAEVSAAVTAKALSASAVLPTQSYLQTLAGNSVIQGAAQGAWWAKQSGDTAFKFSQAVRQGLVSAETNQQIVARVRQVMDISRSNAAALVQTSVATVANDARQAVFTQNEDIIKRYRAVATLDTHTCLQCAPLDGKEWEKDGTPIGHKFPMPSYPLHFNCRCLKIAVVLDGVQGKRASADGPVSGQLTFKGWLERQSKEKQDDILGKGRADLFRKGKITLTDLVTGNGNPLTLAELRKKYD